MDGRLWRSFVLGRLVLQVRTDVSKAGTRNERPWCATQIGMLGLGRGPQPPQCWIGFLTQTRASAGKSSKI